MESSAAGGDQFVLDDVHCNGSESSLLDCQHSPLYVHNCHSTEVAGVSCYNGTVVYILSFIHTTLAKSLLNLCYTTSPWSCMRSRQWPVFFTDVSLKNYGSSQTFPRTFLELCAENSIRLFLGDDDIAFYHGEFDPAFYHDKDRLTRGRVEYCTNQTYHGICGDDWRRAQASVVCRELGLSPYGMSPFILIAILLWHGFFLLVRGQGNLTL